MAKRRLTRRQTWRIEKVQRERVLRARKKNHQIERRIAEGRLGPEQRGRVIAHFGAQVEVESLEPQTAGLCQRAYLRSNLAALVTGDRVVWQPALGEASGQPEPGVVLARMPRESSLSRPDARGQLRPVAANIDLIVVVFAPQPPIVPAMIDRYLVAAEHQGIRPMILLNKVDLLSPAQRGELSAMLRHYEPIGYQLLYTSTLRDRGIDALRAMLVDKTSVFVGQSGVGKSSLINALLPGVHTRVAALSAATGRGRHTTTTARLFHVPGGGDLIDSPGVRDFGLWNMSAIEIARGFRDFKPFLGHCRFRDCAHRQDPGCALRAAIDAGKLDARRLESYHDMVAALAHQC